MKPATAEVLHSVAEVAELWRCSDETVYRLIRDGRLRTCDIGTGRAKTRIPASALTEFVQRRSRKGAGVSSAAA